VVTEIAIAIAVLALVTVCVFVFHNNSIKAQAKAGQLLGTVKDAEGKVGAEVQKAQETVSKVVETIKKDV